MQLGAMRQRVYNFIPQTTAATITPTSINVELNNGMNKVAELTECYRGTAYCSTIAGQQKYSLSSLVPNYLSIWKSGMWFIDSSGEFQKVWPKTKRWLDNFLINWRNSASVEVPTWYVIDGDSLIFQPAPSGVNQFTIDSSIYGQPMTSDTNYPWTNSTTEITSLRPMDDAIVAYAVWKLAPAVFDNEGRNYYEGQFKNECNFGIKILRRRWDMTSDYDYYPRLDIKTGFLPRF
jgi:hypothetical protein